MRYESSAPGYRYTMPCGAEYYSATPSEADDRDGYHWFPCVRCASYHALAEDEVAEYGHTPRGPKRALADSEVAVYQDRARVKDRILRTLWRARHGAVSVAVVAASLAVSARLVRSVAEDIGFFRDSLKD